MFDGFTVEGLFFVFRPETQKKTIAVRGVSETCSRNSKKSTESVNYVLKQIDYKGKWYEAVVPDTLDLSERAKMAINGLGGRIDPDLYYTPYFNIFFDTKTPFMTHYGAADTTCNPWFGESFPMLRIMSGSSQYIELEAAHRTALCSCIHDGLYWDIYTPDRPWRNSYLDSEKIHGKWNGEDFAVIVATGYMLRAMAQWRELSGDFTWDETMHKMVAGMRRVAIFREDYCYYPEKGGWPESCTYPRSGWLNTDEPQSEVEGPEGAVTCYHAGQLHGAACWYALSGDLDALDLAARLTRFCMKPKFWGGIPDPNFIRGKDQLVSFVKALPDPAYTAGYEQGHWYSHFTARAQTLRALLEYGRIVEDERVLEFVRRAYEFTLTQGIPRIGWINCYPVRQDMCDSDAVGNLVALGIRLSDSGLGDYWDDVDAVVRNHLVETQLIRADILEKIADTFSEDRPELHTMPHQQYTVENVIARSLGTFGGMFSPTSIPGPWVMPDESTQALYYAWEGIVRENGNTAQVNLLLNRASRLLDVDSYIPYEGKVVVRNKTALHISVRVPVWASRRELRADVSGKPHPLVWVGNYLLFDRLKPNDTITLQFPIKEVTARYTVNSGTPAEQIYSCTFRGSTLVDISPRDTRPSSYPLYLREYMRKDKAPLKKITRYVPEKVIPTGLL